MDWPVNGVDALEDTVQVGGEVGRGCQLTSTLAGAPLPAAFTPDTEYVCVPAFAEFATHVDAELAQPVHT